MVSMFFTVSIPHHLCGSINIYMLYDIFISININNVNLILDIISINCVWSTLKNSLPTSVCKTIYLRYLKSLRCAALCFSSCFAVPSCEKSATGGPWILSVIGGYPTSPNVILAACVFLWLWNILLP